MDIPRGKHPTEQDMLPEAKDTGFSVSVGDRDTIISMDSGTGIKTIDTESFISLFRFFSSLGYCTKRSALL